MRRITLIALTLLLFTSTGCTVSDVMFSVFQGGYTGGGTTSEEKKHHYDETLRSYDEGNF